MIVCNRLGRVRHLLLLGAAFGAVPAFAQDTPADPTLAPRPAEDAAMPTVPEPVEGQVAFEADAIEYQSDTSVVTATGNVVLRRGDQSVRANTVSWNRDTGQVEASGDVRFVDQDGNQLFTDKVELTDELKAGAMENLLLVLREGGRIAAAKGERDAQGRVRLTHAAYTGCPVEDDNGCPREPTWRITAKTVTYDPTRKRLRYEGARLWLFGLPILPLPGLSNSTNGSAGSGLLIPEVRFSRSNGVEFNDTYYWRMGPNRDLSMTGYLYTNSLPMVSAQYRELNDIGAFQLTGYATRSQRVTVNGAPQVNQRFRGYVDGNGRFQLSPIWSVNSSFRLASDRTFLRRYDISRDDRLRSMIEAERITSRTYLSIAGWAVQTLRVGDRQGMQPVALPAIDYRNHLKDPWLGGALEIHVNSLSLIRRDGQDTQRAFVGGQWDLRQVTGMGQEITITGLVRGDVYHTDDAEKTPTAIYRGRNGWQTRGVATAAVDVRWPLVGPLFGGTQVLTPRVQLVASPPIRNLSVPNEDARAIELEDSNLFALNRFPGYDRIEDGVRFTYGFDWQMERPGWRAKTTIGQSYRLSRKPTLLPDGTGLDSRLSDVVGRTELRFRDFVNLTHRFRLDKDNLAVRRNEFDATVGSRSTYAEIGYLRLNRNISSGLEDLSDREELRFSARAAFARYWSVFGSGVFNLTDRQEDPTLTSDGFQPIRTRLGLAYQDDCLELGVTWRRDFITTGDAKKGNTFLVHFALRNLGLR